MTYQAITATTDLTKKIRYINSWSFSENAVDPGAVARVSLKDGGSGGPLVVEVRLNAADSKALAYGRKPLYFPNGCYVHVTVGTVRGSVDGE